MSINLNSDNSPDNADDGATPAAEYTPAIIRDEEHDFENGGRAPIELEGALNADDLAALFTSSTPKPNPPAQAVAEIVEIADSGNEEREAALKAEVDAQKNNYLRAVADLHNYRRRTDEEIKRIRSTAAERLIKDILPIVDDFELSLAAAQKAQSYEQLIGGVEAVLRKFVDTLAKEGVEAIPAVGETFNPDVHEAVMVVADTGQPDETVTEELRKGYTLHGRVIRPSLVKVAQS